MVINDGTGAGAPPRKPLRVDWSGYEPTADGTLVYKHEWRVVKPDEPNYEFEYRAALRALQTQGIPMPYAINDGSAGARADGARAKRPLLGKWRPE